jgi:two-component system phosphate regulon response regulator PhoB
VLNPTGADAPKGAILLVEDEPDSTILMSQILELEGYQVLQARSGAEALERLFEPGIIAVVLDVMLPGVDGLDICRTLRQDPRTARLPVAFLSARSRNEDRLAGLDAGADVYLTKPISRAGLISAVRWLLDRERVSRPAATSNA